MLSDVAHCIPYLARTAWLPRIMSWTLQYSSDPELNTSMLPPVTEDLHDEVDEMKERLDVVYSLTKTGMKPTSQASLVVSPLFCNSCRSISAKEYYRVTEYGW